MKGLIIGMVLGVLVGAVGMAGADWYTDFQNQQIQQQQLNEMRRSNDIQQYRTPGIQRPC